MEVKVYNFGSIAQSLQMLHESGGEKTLPVQPGGYVAVEQENIMLNEQEMSAKGLVIVGGSPKIPKIPVPVPQVVPQVAPVEVKVEEPVVEPEVKIEVPVQAPVQQNRHQQQSGKQQPVKQDENK